MCILSPTRHLAVALWCALLLVGCHRTPQARSTESFAQIAARIRSMNAAEIAGALGEPDSRQPVFLRDERWIWWNYTYLAGSHVPPELRGRVVHLEVVVRNPEAAEGVRPPYSLWRVVEPQGIQYRQPGFETSRFEVPSGSRS